MSSSLNAPLEKTAAPRSSPEADSTMTAEDRAFLTALFEAAVSAADPCLAIKAHIPNPPKGRTVVIGAGKGAAQLASAFEQQWTGPLTGGGCYAVWI